MKKAILILLPLVLLAACVPTPEITEYRQEDNTMDYHHLSVEIPDTYEKEEIIKDGIRLKVKANVVKPDGELSVGIVKRYPFDISIVKQLGEILWGERPYV